MNDPSVERLGWVVEDNPTYRKEIIETLRDVGVRPLELPAMARLIDAIASIGHGASKPDVIVLDLRLPWKDEATLAADATSGGLECLDLLRFDPEIAAVPVVIYSAFVQDELIAKRLRQYQPLTIVDKLEPARLRTVLKNVLVYQPPRFRRRMKMLLGETEGHLLKIAAAVAGTVTIIGAVTWVIQHLL